MCGSQGRRYLAGQRQAGTGGPSGTLQLDDADEPRLQIVVVAGVAQVQGMGLRAEGQRRVRRLRERKAGLLLPQ